MIILTQRTRFTKLFTKFSIWPASALCQEAFYTHIRGLKALLSAFFEALEPKCDAFLTFKDLGKRSLSSLEVQYAHHHLLSCLYSSRLYSSRLYSSPRYSDRDRHPRQSALQAAYAPFMSQQMLCSTLLDQDWE